MAPVARVEKIPGVATQAVQIAADRDRKRRERACEMRRLAWPRLGRVEYAPDLDAASLPPALAVAQVLRFITRHNGRKTHLRRPEGHEEHRRAGHGDVTRRAGNLDAAHRP